MATPNATAGPPPDLPHDSLSPNIIASGVACWAIASVFVALRFYTRTRIISALNSSDWCILAALIFALGTLVGEIEEAVHGSGRHIWDIPLTDHENGVLWAMAGWYDLLFYSLTLCMSKISILLLYLHLFTFQWIRRAAQVVMGIVILSNIYIIIAIFTACVPLQAYWDTSVEAKFCQPQSVWWANTGLLIITDFLIFLLPMPVVWTLRVPRRQKYALFGIFGLGFFVCLISMIRLKYLIPLIQDPPADFFYGLAPLAYWTMIEINGAIVCACLMTLKPFIVHVLPRVFASSTNSKTGSDKHISPPTIGSKDPLRATKSPRHPRDQSLDEFGDPLDKGFDAALDMEEANGREDAATSSLTTSMSTVEGGTLSPPPVTHLKAPAHKPGANFYDSASDADAAGAKPPVVKSEKPRKNFYDSGSDRTETPF